MSGEYAILIGGFHYEIHSICWFCLSSCWSANIFSLNVYMYHLDTVCSLHCFNPIKKYLQLPSFASSCFIMDPNALSWSLFSVFLFFFQMSFYIAAYKRNWLKCFGKLLASYLYEITFNLRNIFLDIKFRS